jgi:hypothetical protein
MADAFGWTPRSDEIDWDEALADIRRTVFPDEAQRAYGPGAWYGSLEKGARPLDADGKSLAPDNRFVAGQPRHDPLAGS